MTGSSPAPETPGLVSCIIPAYNGERFLAEALGSIAAQTHRQHEIIVVDDGSTDATAAVAHACAGVRYVRQENAGGAAARNRGIGMAGGAFVAFLDADDRWHPEKLERQVARFAARPELDISLAHVQNFWMEEVAADAADLRGHRRTRPLPGYTAGTLLVRRSLFSRVGLFAGQMRHGDQTEWFLRARGLGTISEVLPDILLERRLHGGNASRHFADASRTQYLELVKGVLERRRQGLAP